MQSSTQDPDQGFGQDTGQGSDRGLGKGVAQSPGSSGDIGSELKSDAKQLSTTASNRLHAELDARKGTAATQARSVSSAIGQAAESLDDGAPEWLRSAFKQGAQKAKMFADSLEQKDSRQIVRDVQEIARSNPGAFIAGCAALGFAAARVFKAGASDDMSLAQSRSAQAPPVQGEEPMFRSAGTGAFTSPSPAGELV